MLLFPQPSRKAPCLTPPFPLCPHHLLLMVIGLFIAVASQSPLTPTNVGRNLLPLSATISSRSSSPTPPRTTNHSHVPSHSLAHISRLDQHPLPKTTDISSSSSPLPPNGPLASLHMVSPGTSSSLPPYPPLPFATAPVTPQQEQHPIQSRPRPTHLTHYLKPHFA